MATRASIPVTAAPPITPAFASGWANTASAVRILGTIAKGTSAITAGTTMALVNTANQAYLAYQIILGPFAAQTVAGTVLGQTLARELDSADNVNGIASIIRVFSNDGLTVRGTLLAFGGHGGLSEFLDTGYRNKKIFNGNSLSSLAISEGDYIVIEYGPVSTVGGTTPNSIFKVGENASDLPVDETTTTDGAPWIEFSQDLVFATQLGVRPRFAPGAMPRSDALRGRSHLGRGIPDNFVPTPHAVQAIRIARPVPPSLDGLRGRVRFLAGACRANGFLGVKARIKRPAGLPRVELPQGRAHLGHGVASNFVPTPHAVQIVRVGRAVPPPVDALRAHARRARSFPAQVLVLTSGAFAGARGYVLTPLSGQRAAPLGVFEIDRFVPSYELPYLGTGSATRSIARGVMEFVEGWQTIALGKLRIIVPDVAGNYWIKTRVAHGAVPRLDALSGRGRRAHSFASNFTATPHSIQGVRLARAVPPFLDWLRGRAHFGHGFAPNSTATPHSVQIIRVARAVPPALDWLRGRVHLGRGIAANFFPTDLIFAVRIRTARGAQIPPSFFRGRAHASRGFSANLDLSLVLKARIRRARAVQPFPDLLRGHVRRTQPPVHATFPAELSLLSDLDASALSELSLLADLDAFAREGYRVFARDIETGVETELGFGSTLTGIVIPDGRYSLRVEADGRFWRKVRFAQEFPLTIEAGEIVEPLPEVRALSAQAVGVSVFLSWLWEDQPDTATPEDFAVWTSPSSPVDTSGAPVATAAAVALGTYLLELAGSPATFYVAVAARKGAGIGPVSSIAVSPTIPDLDSPSGQSARIPDGGWK